MPQVVKLEMSDGSPSKWAIQLDDGSFHGQVWEGMSRTYPVWKTKKSVETAMRKLKPEDKDV